MEPLNRIKSLLADRPAQLKHKKTQDKKIVGYIPGGYFPEEIALAAGAVPVGMVRGGEHSAVENAFACVDHWVDTFYRSQIGYATSGDDPYYNLIDVLVVPITDSNNRTLSDTLSYYTDLELFVYGVPHTKSKEGRDYFRHGLAKTADKIAGLTGIEITGQRMTEAIDICNREKELLRELSQENQSGNTALSPKDYVLVNQASMLLDKGQFIENLETLIRELKAAKSGDNKKPKVLLTGSTLALGDDKIIDLLEEYGATVITGEFAEGIKPFQHKVEPAEDFMNALAETYFMERVAPAWFRPGHELPEHLIQTASATRVDGVVWYQLMYREAYKILSHYFPEMLKKETGLPVLTLDSDYDPAETGQMATRIETYIENIRRQP
ncbi:MAG: 2-hydroxyacyl-CoA dehydratase family protein [Thermodesulfobacteriota bacterium]